MDKQQSLDLLITNQPSSNNPQQQQNDHQTLDPFTVASLQFPSTSSVRYGECLRNHAAKMGGHVTDGCGEFMPECGEDGSSPEFFKCAACSCHRNFHRKETVRSGNRYFDYRNRAAGEGHSSPFLAQPVVMMNFGGMVVDEEDNDHDIMMFQQETVLSGSQKRPRTKFTREQKEEMADFAERIGWKIQRDEEEHLLQFCAKIGVKRQAFKVWMHNSRQATKRKEGDQQEP
ncbi:hypothetical protein SAY87_025023 [Trapa incisa]|uniref:ZF-HD dimerization-type domain-containing protein n=1 Tax=Trapa incisa TaxID=236973 RepID=A0AAN7GF89_9MYRT|nr:hypothetical protein SAY87_025023 [Trapa incisa]